MKFPRFLVISFLAVVGLAAAWRTGLLGKLGTALQDVLVRCLEAIERLDPTLAVLAFIGLYILATLFFFPGLIITMGAGILFGPVKGTVIVSLASVAGSSLCFLIGRHFARSWVSRKAAKSPRFRAIDEAIGGAGAKIVLLLRLSPLFPYNLLNYSLGLTRVRFGSYVLASWIGMFPGTLLYVYIGSAAGSIAALAAGTGEAKTPTQWVLFGGGLLATIAVTVFVTRIATHALNKHLAD